MQPLLCTLGIFLASIKSIVSHSWVSLLLQISPACTGLWNLCNTHRALLPVWHLYLWIHLQCRATGNVKPSQYPPNQGTAKLTAIDKVMILELVIQKPGIYLREIQGRLLERTGTDVNVSTIIVHHDIMCVLAIASSFMLCNFDTSTEASAPTVLSLYMY